MSSLKEHFEQAEKGKELWLKLDEKCGKGHYIVFPHIRDEYNLYALVYMDRYIESAGIEKPVIVTADPGVSAAVRLFSDKHILVELMSETEIRLILKYYGLYEFTSRITIISLTIPYNTRGENFLGIKGITKKDLLCYDIYRFGCVPSGRIPDYTGANPEVIELLALGDRK